MTNTSDNSNAPTVATKTVNSAKTDMDNDRVTLRVLASQLKEWPEIKSLGCNIEDNTHCYPPQISITFNINEEKRVIALAKRLLEVCQKAELRIINAFVVPFLVDYNYCYVIKKH